MGANDLGGGQPLVLHRPVKQEEEAAVLWSVDAVQALLDQPFNDLLFQAQTVHREYWPEGDIELATLLSVKTGGCPENCGYCPQAAEFDTGVKAQKLMEVDEVVRAAQAAKDAGATRFCMGAAWRAPKDRDVEKVAVLVEAVKGLGLQTCATLGMLEPHHATQLKAAGLTTTTTTSTPHPSTTPTWSARGPTRTGSIRCSMCAQRVSACAAAGLWGWGKPRCTAPG